jgi:hypothetical protein
MSDVEDSGLIEEVIDAGKRAWDRAKEGVGEHADRLRERYAAERRERMLRLVLVVAVVYLMRRD